MAHLSPFNLIVWKREVSPFVFHGRKQLIRNDKQVSNCYFRLNYCVNREVEDSDTHTVRHKGIKQGEFMVWHPPLCLISFLFTQTLGNSKHHRVLKHFSKLWEKVQQYWCTIKGSFTEQAACSVILFKAEWANPPNFVLFDGALIFAMEMCSLHTHKHSYKHSQMIVR